MMVSYRASLRSLRRTPGFSAAAVLTLGIGLGATLTIFTVLNAVLLNPLPFPDAGRLAGAWLSLPGMKFPLAPQSLGTYFTFRSARTIEGMAIWDRRPANLASTDGSPAERLPATYATASLFSVLRVQPARGRAFTEAEDVPHAEPVVVISDGLWRRRFGHSGAVLGKTIELDNVRRTIIGVMPAGFHYPDAQTEVWLPLGLDPNAAFTGPFGHFGLVRVKPGVSFDAVAREMNALLPRVVDRYPNIGPGMPQGRFFADARISALLHPLRDDVVGAATGFPRELWIAGAAGLLLLLIASFNVASLLLTRAEARQREIAIRTALGAGPGHVFEQFLAEAILLACAGGVLGLLLAYGGVALFVHLGPPGIPRLPEVRVTPTVAGAALVLVALVAVLCSILPALKYAPRHVAGALRDGGRGGTVGRDRQRARRSLVIAQVAFAMVLVGGATILLRSFELLRAVRPGFDPAHELTMWFSLSPQRYATDTDVERFMHALTDRVSGIPGVRVAAVTSKIPLSPFGSIFTPIWADEGPHAQEKLPPAIQPISVSGSYFAAMGIPVIAGKTFAQATGEYPYDVIVDRTFAAENWGDSTGARAIGHKLWMAPSRGGPAYTVVGVVGAVHDTSLAAAPSGLVYQVMVPAPDTNFSAMMRTAALVVRSSGDPQGLIAPVEAALRAVDPSVPAFAVQPMSALVTASMTRLSFVMMLLGLAAGIALLLAGVGLYGVLGYMVSLRTKEIGVRIALGAEPGRVARSVTSQGAMLGLAGISAGCVAFIAAARGLRALLYNVTPYDPTTILAVAAVILVTATMASWLPARRASRIDPMRALGVEK